MCIQCLQIEHWTFNVLESEAYHFSLLCIIISLSLWFFKSNLNFSRNICALGACVCISSLSIFSVRAFILYLLPPLFGWLIVTVFHCYSFPLLIFMDHWILFLLPIYLYQVNYLTRVGYLTSMGYSSIASKIVSMLSLIYLLLFKLFRIIPFLTAWTIIISRKSFWIESSTISLIRIPGI